MKLREAVSLYTIGSHQMSEAVVLQATEPGARVRALDLGLTWVQVNLGLGAEPGADRRIESQVPFWSAVYGNPSKCMLLGALGSLHLGVVSLRQSYRQKTGFAPWSGRVPAFQ